MINKTVRFNLRQILEAKKLTQATASKMTGISKNGISHLTCDPRSVALETLAKICKGLNVSPADLFTLE